MPSETDGRAQNEARRLSGQAQAAPAAVPDAEESADSTTAAGATSKSPPAAAPPAPSSSEFEFSHAGLLSLLRFYGWTIPDEWVFVESDALWSAAAQEGLHRTDADPIERRILFSPSPYLLKHFDHIQTQLRLARRMPAAASEDPSAKLARSDTSQCVATAATSDSHLETEPFECLDVACGSGRDMCWLLWTTSTQAVNPDSTADTAAAPSSATWRVSGVDVSTSSLDRAQHLARQLGVSDALETYQGRINQSSGEWRVAAGNKPPHTGPAAASVVDANNNQTHANAIDSVAPVELIAAPVVTSPDVSSVSDPAAAATDSVAPPAKLTGSQLRREKRKQKDALRAAAAAVAPPRGSYASPFLARQYDLIVMVRFLSRVFLRTQLARLLRPGGFFLLSTFIEDGVTHFEHPANPEFRIAGVEEIEKFARDAGLLVVANNIGRCEDGRPISDCLLRKPYPHEEMMQTSK